eukprot:CAMPEP_0168742934 /NCGR_PEP_ID=MMETSP0724-20121128/13298_1 /TAXON_ID=265536 /ORGANISM="Amphiprora sp., Strain CCMP467" /LENGTH=251 /DNA_ID=CAMNT_0008790511 /DNA_START=68 /DNA_END=823 /DNA_ORIENTATION=+
MNCNPLLATVQPELVSIVEHRRETEIASLSLHSTFTVEDALKEEEADHSFAEEDPIASRHHHHRRRVSFATEQDQELGGEQVLYDDEIQRCWWRADDYEAFSANACDTIEAIQETQEAHRNEETSYMNVMEDVWEACCNVKQEPQDYTTCLDADLQASMAALFCETPCSSADENDNTDCACYGIGLEKHAVEFIQLVRANRRRRLQTVVHRLQTSCHDEALRTACEKMTRANRIFAVALARAQQQPPPAAL